MAGTSLEGCDAGFNLLSQFLHALLEDGVHGVAGSMRQCMGFAFGMNAAEMGIVIASQFAMQIVQHLLGGVEMMQSANLCRHILREHVDEHPVEVPVGHVPAVPHAERFPFVKVDPGFGLVCASLKPMNSADA